MGVIKMSEEKKSKPKAKKVVALRNLATAKDGQVKAGQECTCTEAELKVFKKIGAV